MQKKNIFNIIKKHSKKRTCEHLNETKKRFLFSELLTPLSSKERNEYSISYYSYTDIFRCRDQILYKYGEYHNAEIPDSSWTVYYYYTDSYTHVKRCVDENEDEYGIDVNWICIRHSNNNTEDDYVLIAPNFTEDAIEGWFYSYEHYKLLDIWTTNELGKNVDIVRQTKDNGFKKEFIYCPMTPTL